MNSVVRRLPLPVLAFVLCFAVLLWRCRARLAHAHLWAEDGRLFFADALQRGYAATFEQFAGYFHVLPRLLSATFVHLPLQHYALLINVSCLALYAAAASLLARPSLRALIPHDGLRVLGAVALCFLPGLWEVLGNVANVHSVVFLAAMLLCLKDLDSPLRPWEVALVLFIGSTAGELVVLVPVFVLRGFLRWRRGDGLQAQGMEWLVVAIMLGWALLNAWMTSRFLKTPGADNTVPGADARFYALTVLSTLSTRFLLQPVLGDKATLWLHAHVAGMTAVSLGLLAVLAWRLLASRNRMVLVLGLAALCAWGMLPLTWMVRPGSATLYPFLRIPDLGVLEHRYAWVGTPLAVVLWLVVLQSLGPLRQRPAVAMGLCALVIGLVWHRGKVTPFGAERDWGATVAKLRAIPPGQSGEVPENPEGWLITVTGPVP